MFLTKEIPLFFLPYILGSKQNEFVSSYRLSVVNNKKILLAFANSFLKNFTNKFARSLLLTTFSLLCMLCGDERKIYLIVLTACACRSVHFEVFCNVLSELFSLTNDKIYLFIRFLDVWCEFVKIKYMKTSRNFVKLN